MHPSRSSLAAIFFLIAFCIPAHARQFEAIRLPGSPASYVFGGGTSAILTDDPMASIANPGQIGIQAFNNRIMTAFSSGRYDTLGGSFRGAAISLGTNISPMLGIGVPIAIGVSYTTTSLHFGVLLRDPTGPGPDINLEVDQAWHTITLSAAIDCGVIASFGVAHNSINTDPSTHYQFARHYPITGETWDLGGIVVVPIGRIFRPSEEDLADCEWLPVVDLSMGFARSNLPANVPPESDWFDLYAKSATIGTAVRIGADLVVNGKPQNLVLLTVSREACQRLVGPEQLDTLGNIVRVNYYYDGFGQIDLWKNVILGKDERLIDVRDGVDFALLGAFSYRYGWERGVSRKIDAYGFGLSLSGLAGFLRRFSGALSSSSVLRLMEEKVGIRFDYSSSRTTLENFAPSDFYGLTITYR